MLLPPESKQHQIISAKITELGKQIPPGTIPQTSPDKQKSPMSKAAAGLGAIGLLFWKLKALLFGLAKATTLLSMLASLGVYWAIFGWKFALRTGAVDLHPRDGSCDRASEAGIQGEFADVYSRFGRVDSFAAAGGEPREDAEIGLAGPIYGLGCCGVCFAALAVHAVADHGRHRRRGRVDQSV